MPSGVMLGRALQSTGVGRTQQPLWAGGAGDSQGRASGAAPGCSELCPHLPLILCVLSVLVWPLRKQPLCRLGEGL